MQRVKNIFALIAAVVALLLLAFAARSYWQLDSLYFEWGGRGYYVSSVNGQLGVIQTSRPFGIATYNFGSYAVHEREPIGVLEAAVSNDATHRWGVVSFGSGNVHPTSQFMGQLGWLSIPMALPVALLFIPAGFRMRAMLRQRSRQNRQLCIVCGYDLRGTPDRCPECGATPMLAGQATPALV